jgi:hypothetical protein
MSSYPAGRRPRSADPHSKLRLAALAAVIVGVVLLAAAAFVLSYSGIHQIALQAGVSPDLAKLYPVIFDAMLVIAGAAAMALRGAGWWPRFYAWAALIILLAAVATGDAVHATNTVLPARASRAAVAVTPWVLLLLAFGLLLEMLRHFRKARATVMQARQAALAAGSGTAGDANGTAGGGMGVTWAGAAGTAAAAGAAGHTLPQRGSGLVKLLEPRTGQPPAIEGPYDDTGHEGYPVSYGDETGYVHPDSWGEGEYSPHGDSGGPGEYAAPGGYLGHAEAGGYLTGHDTAGADESAGGHDPAGEENGRAGAGAPAEGQAPGNGAPQADGAGTAGATTEAGTAGATTEAGTAGATAEPGSAAEHGQDDATGEPPGTGEPGLERMWSTPSRPEE